MLYNLPWELNYLSSKPFYNIGTNTWEVAALSFITVLRAINYKNNYVFAFRNGNNSIPMHIHRTKKITIKDEHSPNNSDKSTEPSDTSKSKHKILKDKYLILCNVKNPDTESDKYIANLSKAFNTENYYPVLLFPKHIDILSYSKNKQLSFQKLLKPLGNKHGFQFVL